MLVRICRRFGSDLQNNHSSRRLVKNAPSPARLGPPDCQAFPEPGADDSESLIGTSIYLPKLLHQTSFKPFSLRQLSTNSMTDAQLAAQNADTIIDSEHVLYLKKVPPQSLSFAKW